MFRAIETDVQRDFCEVAIVAAGDGVRVAALDHVVASPASPGGPPAELLPMRMSSALPTVIVSTPAAIALPLKGGNSKML